MKYAHIYLTPNETNPLGVIGDVQDETGKPMKGHQLVDVISQVSKFPKANDFLVHCHGPGGAVDVGDQIYDYLNGLKAEGKNVDTITDGDVGSIITKVFMVGRKRTVVDGAKFYIHAPWVSHLQGNASQIIQGLEGIMKEEERLLNFYKTQTGLTEAGLKGLMDGSSGQDGTYLSADQAVALKFATHKAPSKIKAFALIKQASMNTKKLTPGQVFAQKLGTIMDQVFGTSAATINALELPGEKGMIYVNTEDPENLVGAECSVMDEAGNSVPAPDGEHKLTDGRTLVVAGGKVAEVKPAEAPASPAPTASEKELRDKIASLEQANAVQAQEIASLKSVDVNAAITKAIEDFKASYPALGKPPVRAINTNGQPVQNGHRSIAQAMEQKREERKKQIFKN